MNVDSYQGCKTFLNVICSKGNPPNKRFYLSFLEKLNTTVDGQDIDANYTTYLPKIQTDSLKEYVINMETENRNYKVSEEEEIKKRKLTSQMALFLNDHREHLPEFINILKDCISPPNINHCDENLTNDLTQGNYNEKVTQAIACICKQSIDIQERYIEFLKGLLTMRGFNTWVDVYKSYSLNLDRNICNLFGASASFISPNNINDFYAKQIQEIQKCAKEEKKEEIEPEPALDPSLPIAIAASIKEPEKPKEPEPTLDPSIPIAIAASIREPEKPTPEEPKKPEPVKATSYDSVTYVTPQGVVYIHNKNDPESIHEYEGKLEDNTLRQAKLTDDKIQVYHNGNWTTLDSNNFKDLYPITHESNEEQSSHFYNDMVAASKWVFRDIAKSNNPTP